jgi:hypothetical protein
MGEACRKHGNDEKYIKKMLVGIPEGKRPLRRTRRKLEDNIRMDLVEIGWKLWSARVWVLWK